MRWLDDFTRTSERIATLAPRDFIEGAAIWLLSATVGRRCVLRLAEETAVPLVWPFLIAPSAVHGKSTLLGLVRDVARRSGVVGMLADATTPEALISALAERSHSAWVIEEASSLLNGMARRDGYLSSLRELLLQAYDAPPSLSRRTKTDGLIEVRYPSLHTLAVSTPAMVRQHLADPAQWASGWWSRFVVLLADEPKPYERPTLGREELEPFAERLRAVAARLDEARATASEPLSAQIADGVLDDHYEWFAGLHAETAAAMRGGLGDALASARMRTPSRAMRCALLAAIGEWADGGGGRVPIITREHHAFGREMATKWLRHAERALEAAQASEGDPLADRVLALLDRRGGRIKQNEALNNLKVDSRRLQGALAELGARGLVTTKETSNVNGTTTVWIARRYPEDEITVADVMDLRL